MDTPTPTTSDAAPAPAASIGGITGEFFTAIAAAQGMTPQGLLEALIAPFEQRMADRIIDGVVSKLKNTAEVSKPNADLQKELDAIPGIDLVR